ncbi:LOW QUALITY PROTEIN: hypothetical protein HID58_053039 [Brassica napus]|uniref:Uncharacterized protein n=1 Tax=Brassica napus TaxID=3708 RepID=A0ABQ8ADK1_BRANA|nr:LOW QUALITY PROTEIN: hypothetical protein HID58_053039 [Brassica napus]
MCVDGANRGGSHVREVTAAFVRDRPLSEQTTQLVYVYNDLSMYMHTMLIVHPMMELVEDKEAGWGKFDCEIHDRKVGYMVEILKAGHKFQKCGLLV